MQHDSRGTDIGRSCRDDYRRYIDDQVGDIETANRVGNVREMARLTKALTGRGKHRGSINDGDVTEEELEACL